EEARGTIEAGKHGLLQSVETRKQEIQDEVAKGKTAVATGKREIEETVFEGKSDIATGKREIEETVSEGKTAFATGKREIEETVLEGKSVIAIGKREIEETVAKGTIFIASGKREIEVKVSESKSAFATGKREIEETVSECKSAVTTGKREIEETVAKGTIFIASGKREIEGTVSECKSAVATGKREIEDTASEALQKIRDVSTLSYAEQKKELDDQFKDDTFYKEVEFLFYLTLRDSCDVCDLTDMIRDQLINRIYQQDKRTAALSTMHSVLSNNKCVIIIDGLDEWTHPNDTNCSCSEEDKVIPYLAPTIDATVLITSRPWRMSQQRVKDTKIDTYLEIEGTACIGLLLQKVMDSLNE
ncbi:hypothetical protein MAR_003056, partial [Mya arenaria]